LVAHYNNHKSLPQEVVCKYSVAQAKEKLYLSKSENLTMKAVSTEKSNNCHIEVSVDKEFYDHDDIVNIHFKVDNSQCNKDLESIKIELKLLQQCLNYKITDILEREVLLTKIFPIKVKEKTKADTYFQVILSEYVCKQRSRAQYESIFQTSFVGDISHEEKYLLKNSLNQSERTIYTSQQYYLKIGFQHKGFMKKKELVKPIKLMIGINPPRPKFIEDFYNEERIKFLTSQSLPQQDVGSK